MGSSAALLLAFAGLNGAVAVAMGAWAAHGLEKAHGARAVALVESASRYQMIHAVALLGALLLAAWLRGGAAGRDLATLRLPTFCAQGAAALFALGMVLFCGALYALAFGGPRWMGMVAPLGGLAMILGWLAVAGAGIGLYATK